MKLLLTSQGFYNESIKKALYSLLDQPIQQTNIILVTTAANASGGDKRWLISIMNQLVEMEFKNIDLLEFSGLSEELWLPRLESADVIFFSGGNSLHLMYELKKAGVITKLQELLKTKIYVGNSAGSIVATKNLSLSNPKHKSYDSNRARELNNDALELTPFLLRPHYNSPGHPSSELEVKRMMGEHNVKEDVYLIDDNTAIKVVDGEIEVISEGEWKLLK